MALSVFYSSITTSTTTFSKTHLPIAFYNDELLSSLHFNCYLKRNFSGQTKKAKYVKAVVAESSPAAKSSPDGDGSSGKKLRVLVAGGGIGGLVFALAAKRKGFDVVVFEKDLSAVRGEGQYRGPIQIQSNALAALEAIDLDVAEQVMAAGCVTGDRINGLVDGVSGNW